MTPVCITHYHTQLKYNWVPNCFCMLLCKLFLYQLFSPTNMQIPCILSPFLTFVPRCLFTEENLRKNFRIVGNSDTQNIAYDYDSIMHYDAYAFSSNSQPTIQPVDESVSLDRIGQRNALSELDIRHIQQLYCKGMIMHCQECSWSVAMCNAIAIVHS